MTTFNNTSAKGTSSSLSVDAAVFVPSKFSQSHDAGPHTAAAAAPVNAGEDGKDRHLMEVPPYITSCYPFVNPNVTPRPPTTTQSASGPKPFLHQGQACFHGGNMRHRYPMAPSIRYTHHQQWVGNPQPTHVSQPLVMGPLAAGVRVPFDGGISSVGPGLLPTPALGDGLLPTPPYPPLSLSAMMGAGGLSKGIQYMAGLPVSTPAQSMLHADGRKKSGSLGVRRGGGRGAKVSTGTQKETQRASHNRLWGHTVIMKDNSAQTDFHTDIADLTLGERASVLYRRGQRKNKGSQLHVSTDSEEVDSDSGYSSPLHRRNLVSNGTHPVRISALLEAADSQHNTTTVGVSGLLTTSPAVAAGSVSGRKVGSTSASKSTLVVLETADRESGSRTKEAGEIVTKGIGSGPDDARTKSLKTSLPALGSSQQKGDGAVVQSQGQGHCLGGDSMMSGQLMFCKDAVSMTSVRGQGSPSSKTVHLKSASPAEQAGIRSTEGKGKSSRPADVAEDSLQGAKDKGGNVTHVKGGGETIRSISHKGSPSSAPLASALAAAVGAKVATPDFPVLRPARRNEPPWSLTPHSQRSKVVYGDASGDGRGTFGGNQVVGSPQGIKSYASIVKSASSSNAIGGLQSAASCPITVGRAGGQQGSWGEQPRSGKTDSGADLTGTKQRCDTWADRVRPTNSGVTVDGDGVGKGASVIQCSSVAASSHQQPPSHQLPQVPNDAGLGQYNGARLHSPSHTPCSMAGVTGEKGRSPTHALHNVASIPGGGMQGGHDSSVNSRHVSPGGGMQSGHDSSVNSRHVSPGGGIQGDHDSSVNSRHVSPGGGMQSVHNSSVQSRHVSPGGSCRMGKTRSTDSSPATPKRHNSHSRQSPHGHVTRTQTSPGPITDDEERSEKEDGGKKRPRRRRHRRRRKTKVCEDGMSDGLSGMERTVSSSNISRASDIMLHFDDDLEFPDLSTASTPQNMNSLPLPNTPQHMDNLPLPRVDSVSSLSYSDILKQKPLANDVRSRTQSAPGSCLSGEEGADENFSSQPGQGSVGQVTMSRRARKRRKRRELANRAAEAELAEISLEQQMLRELGQKVVGNSSRSASGTRQEKSPLRGLITDQTVVQQSKGAAQGPGQTGKKLHQPIALNIADMLDAFEKRKTLEQTVVSKKASVKDESKVSLNILDATSPAKRGKERETPKAKKPSPLKKVILKEREEKKRLRLIDDCDMYNDLDMGDNPQGMLGETLDGLDNDTGNPVALCDSDLSQDALSTQSVDTDQGVSPGADLSPISQTSPLSMSPLTPGASPVNSPIAGGLSRDPVVLRIHSRRFREYCTQILDKDIDACCTSLLHELVRFQDRMYHKDPTKAKSKRRIVLGLREVTKHLKLKKIKCVIISPNLEKIQSKGGLDEALNNILTMCQEQSVPFVFALGRRALGRACAKLVPVSVAGIFNYEGCEDKFNQLISLTHKGREAYEEMKQAVEREIAENPPPAMSAGSSMPNLYAHMGHSRTPSGCSAISFTSSVLSEPISENYPYAEPETDSKGFEIMRDEGSVGISAGHSVCHNGGGRSAYQPTVDEIDDGNEADVEDLSDNPRRKKTGGGRHVDERVAGGGGRGVVVSLEPVEVAHKPTPVEHGESEQRKKETSDDEHSESECDSQHELPHIDSIHSSMYELSTEILSQHSSRTIDNSEVLSTHSSHTLGESSLPHSAERLRQDGQRTPDGMQQASPVRLMNSDRIQNWVEATQLCLQDMNCSPQAAPDVSDDDSEEFVEAREILKDSDSDTDTENSNKLPQYG